MEEWIRMVWMKEDFDEYRMMKEKAEVLRY
jgi:hypothetical protein